MLSGSIFSSTSVIAGVPDHSLKICWHNVELSSLTNQFDCGAINSDRNTLLDCVENTKGVVIRLLPIYNDLISELKRYKQFNVLIDALSLRCSATQIKPEVVMENREGQAVPNVAFRARDDQGWVETNTDQLFKGKRVIVFALPGAFTPTCSATHLPRYEKLAPVFKAQGIDDIICVSVNDGFIMHAWAKDQDITDVRLLPDGNGDFSRGMGMLVEKQDLGFGDRSWRYSMLVDDGIVKKMFVEADVPGDPFDVSDADTMLSYINSDAVIPDSVAVISRIGCPHCQRAKDLLTEQGITYSEIVVGRDIDQTVMRNLTGATSVPQVYIAGQLIGGADDLTEYLKLAPKAA
jgi:glutaredoxin-like protein